MYVFDLWITSFFPIQLYLRLKKKRIISNLTINFFSVYRHVHAFISKRWNMWLQIKASLWKLFPLFDVTHYIQSKLCLHMWSATLICIYLLWKYISLIWSQSIHLPQSTLWACFNNIIYITERSLKWCFHTKSHLCLFFERIRWSFQSFYNDTQILWRKRRLFP